MDRGEAVAEAGLTNKGTLVSHVGRRDSYELAYALSAMGNEVHLITDYYHQPNSFMGRAVSSVLGSKVNKRYREDLEVIVHSSLPLLVLDFLERSLPRNK